MCRICVRIIMNCDYMTCMLFSVGVIYCIELWYDVVGGAVLYTDVGLWRLCDDPD